VKQFISVNLVMVMYVDLQFWRQVFVNMHLFSVI